MVALLPRADHHASILLYDVSVKVNALTHQNQVPVSKAGLSKHFPRFYMNGGKMVTKCKIVTSIPIKEIKWTIMPQSQNYSYYVTATQLRALRNGKAGYFLFAHPELTHCNEFIQVLAPLLKEQYGVIHSDTRTRI